MGILVVVAWYAGWTRIIQLHPGLPVVAYNMALGFIFLGAGLILLTLRRASLAAVPAVLAILLGLATFLGFLIPHGADLNEVFFSSARQASTGLSSQMSVLTAICFVLTGTAILLAGWGERSKAVLIASGTITSRSHPNAVDRIVKVLKDRLPDKYGYHGAYFLAEIAIYIRLNVSKHLKAFDAGYSQHGSLTNPTSWNISSLRRVTSTPWI